jgi:hypothetical protein
MGASVAARTLHEAWLALRKPGIALHTCGCERTQRLAIDDRKAASSGVPGAAWLAKRARTCASFERTPPRVSWVKSLRLAR